MLLALEAVPEQDSRPSTSRPTPGADRPVDFETLYRENRTDLYSYVAGLLRDRHAAEDVTGLAFERAFRKWHRFDPSRGSARGWLFGIARNAALDELRKRKREAPLTAEPTVLESDSGAFEQLEQSERRAALDRALATLRPADRELIALKFFAHLTNVEIAQATGDSATNVGTRIHRAMTRLRNSCEEDLR